MLHFVTLIDTHALSRTSLDEGSASHGDELVIASSNVLDLLTLVTSQYCNGNVHGT